MIYDEIANLNKYIQINKYIDDVIVFLSNNNLNELSLGKHEIIGDQVYVNIVESNLLEEQETVYELHHSYLDLHLDIDGEELIQFTPYCMENVQKEYDAEGDYELLTGKANLQCVLDNQHFSICMLGEPHMPCVKIGEKKTIKKAIFKIKHEEN